MLFFIAIHGGLRIMMGQHARSEALFYYFRIEDQVPENHLLRLIDRNISFDFVRQKLKDAHSDTGRPSIDPGKKGNGAFVSALTRIVRNRSIKSSGDLQKYPR
jgi:hypothetical protein